jgi:hypothetical protein
MAGLSIVALAASIVFASQLRAQDCCDPAGPFVLGEDFPKNPATCETIEYWAGRAPATEARISLAIKGKLASVKSDGALAYLIMCDAPAFQIMCVTYSTNGLRAGDTVMFAGGYNRGEGKRIMLDPCLASLER